MATVVSDRKRTETLVCDGCRLPLDGQVMDPDKVLALSSLTSLWHFHAQSCLRRWVLRFDPR